RLEALIVRTVRNDHGPPSETLAATACRAAWRPRACRPLARGQAGAACLPRCPGRADRRGSAVSALVGGGAALRASGSHSPQLGESRHADKLVALGQSRPVTGGALGD